MTRRHLYRVDWAPRHGVELGNWPMTIPAVRQLVDDGGWDVPPGPTFLVGENGSGKSTLVEALAAIYPRHGHATPGSPSAGAAPQPEDSPLRWHLRARTDSLASPAGFFLRSETIRQHMVVADAQRAVRGRSAEQLLHQSHGEAVLSILREHFTEPGVYFLDEPESGLSFTAMLGLVRIIAEMACAGCQLIIATHSPLLAALPNANIFELGEWGIRRVRWDELQLVDNHRAYLADPTVFLRHLLDDLDGSEDGP